VEFSLSGYKYDNTLVATSNTIYQLGEYSSSICKEYTDIRAINNYCSTSDSTVIKRIFISDGGMLKECDMTSGSPVYKEYPNITGVDQIVIDEYGTREETVFEKHAAIFILKDSDLYRFDLDSLSIESSYSSPVMSGVKSIRENIREPYKVEIYAKGGLEVYVVGSDGVLVKDFSSNAPLTMYQRFSEYSTYSAVYSYGKAYRMIDGRACRQLSCSAEPSTPSGICYALFADGKLHPISILSGDSLAALRVGEAMFSGVGSFGRQDGKTYVMYKDGIYCPDISVPTVTYDFSSYDALINCPVESTSTVRQLFGVPIKAVIFATNSGIYRTNLDKATL